MLIHKIQTDLHQPSIDKHIACFKQIAPPEKSIITLAGTGPNGAAHVSIINKLSLDYLKKVQKVNVLSGSCFSLMACLANQWGYLNRQAFIEYDRRVRTLHASSIFKVLRHILRGNVGSKNIFENSLIHDTIVMLFSQDFADIQLSEIDYPFTFYAYCQKNHEIVELSRTTFPNMTLSEVARSGASVPFMHGTYSYYEHEFSDPLYCSHFNSFRRRLFASKGSHLFVNHKKTESSKRIYFLRAEERRFSELAMVMDFIRFYLGISNRYVNKLHRRLGQKVL